MRSALISLFNEKCLCCLTSWTYPGVRYFFKRGSCNNSMLRISKPVIIQVPAFCTDPACHTSVLSPWLKIDPDLNGNYIEGR